MTKRIESKYGSALTGSDWVGLPLRIGHVPETGHIEELSSDTDSVLIWSGGPSEVSIRHSVPNSDEPVLSEFKRGSGTVDLIPHGTKLHSIDWQGKPSICTSVNFPESSLSELCSTSSAGLDPARGPRFGLLDSHVVDLTHRLQAQAEGQEDFGAVYVQSLSLALASYVTAKYGVEAAADSKPRPGSLSKSQCHQIEEFVDHEVSSNFGLVDLASLTGYCPDHFSRLFKQAFEQSPHQYVLSRRVERAKAMLRNGSRPIVEIATACGFANQAHLTTAFKRRTGTTPAAYRKG